MAILDKIGGLLGGGLAEKIAEIIGQHISDKAAAAKASTDLQAAIAQRAGELEAAIAKAQSETNNIEAASDDKFKGRWRPLIGYICAAALAYEFVLRPLIAWGSGIAQWPAPPPLETQDILAILTGILGLGTLRTTEKVKGAD